MHFTAPSALLTLSSLAALTLSAPTGQQPISFPLKNGFPNPSAASIAAIEKAAGGTLPNGPAPPNPGAGGLTALRLIAFNEIFEVAYFTDLIHNITTGVPGYKVTEGRKDYVIKALHGIQAQEQLHALDANGALSAFGADPIQPCKYIFPANDLHSAFGLAATFTDLVLGTLQAASAGFAQAGSFPLVSQVASIIGQEGEQNGYYRSLMKNVPSSAPFLTTSSPVFAWSALQSFVVPGSCPNANTIDIPILAPLTVVNAASLGPVNGTASFSVDPSKAAVDASSSVVYISGQNLPVTVPITNFKSAYGAATFDAAFPFEAGFSKGLTIAAVVPGSGSFADASAVAAAAKFGPGLIEVQ